MGLITTLVKINTPFVRTNLKLDDATLSLTVVGPVPSLHLHGCSVFSCWQHYFDLNLWHMWAQLGINVSGCVCSSQRKQCLMWNCVTTRTNGLVKQDSQSHLISLTKPSLQERYDWFHILLQAEFIWRRMISKTASRYSLWTFFRNLWLSGVVLVPFRETSGAASVPTAVIAIFDAR